MEEILSAPTNISLTVNSKYILVWSDRPGEDPLHFLNKWRLSITIVLK